MDENLWDISEDSYSDFENLLHDHATAVLERFRKHLFTTPIEPNRVVLITGSGPFAEADLKTLTAKLGLHLDDAERVGIPPPLPWYAVVGRREFDRSKLAFCLVDLPRQLGLQQGISFMSQEAFFNLWFFGVEPNYVPGDPRIANHPGLAYLASISDGPGWPWPTTEVVGSGDDGNWNNDHWNDESPLKARFGYSVAQNSGLTDAHRRRILDEAVNAYRDPLPLEQVANHIAWLARMAKLKDDPALDTAIARWEADLAYLKQRYYRQHLGFLWPSTEF